MMTDMRTLLVASIFSCTIAQASPKGVAHVHLAITYIFGGRVVSTPAGIDCQSRPANSSTLVGTCGADFAKGAVVTLAWTATMAAGPAQFQITGPDKTSKNCAGSPAAAREKCTLTLSGDRTVTVNAVTVPPPP